MEPGVLIEWGATVDVERPGASEMDADRLAQALPGEARGVTDSRNDRITVYFVVEGHTVAEAMSAADREIRAASARAFGAALVPVGARVLTLLDYQREEAQPRKQDLVGYTEVGKMLGVSRQRARQLAEENPGFPAPVARLAAGPVFSRASVRAFELAWPRRRTGRPPRKPG